MDARDMRDMEWGRQLRAGQEETGHWSWRGVAGFEKHTKVGQSVGRSVVCSRSASSTHSLTFRAH